MSVRHTLAEAEERHERSEGGDRLVSLAAAIIAVLAALGTLFSHHRSISALTAKNQAILEQARASDAYNAYEAKNIRAQVADIFISANILTTPAARKTLQELLDRERGSAGEALEKARELEQQSDALDQRSERILSSYETLEIATTFFEIAIVLVSISALVRRRVFLSVGSALSVIGIVLLVVGLFQGR